MHASGLTTTLLIAVSRRKHRCCARPCSSVQHTERPAVTGPPSSAFYCHEQTLPFKIHLNLADIRLQHAMSHRNPWSGTRAAVKSPCRSVCASSQSNAGRRRCGRCSQRRSQVLRPDDVSGRDCICAARQSSFSYDKRAFPPGRCASVEHGIFEAAAELWLHAPRRHQPTTRICACSERPVVQRTGVPAVRPAPCRPAGAARPREAGRGAAVISPCSRAAPPPPPPVAGLEAGAAAGSGSSSIGSN